MDDNEGPAPEEIVPEIEDNEGPAQDANDGPPQPGMYTIYRAPTCEVSHFSESIRPITHPGTLTLVLNEAVDNHTHR